MELDNNSQYAFWFWKEQFCIVISAIASFVEYDLDDQELELIKFELRGTDDEKGYWGSYLLSGKKQYLTLYLAYDSEEGNDMIHIQIPATGKLLIQLETLNLIQSLLKEK